MSARRSQTILILYKLRKEHTIRSLAGSRRSRLNMESVDTFRIDIGCLQGVQGVPLVGNGTNPYGITQTSTLQFASVSVS